MGVTLTDSTLMRRGASNKHAISLPPIERPNRRSTLQTLRPPQSSCERLKKSNNSQITPLLASV